MNDDEQHEPQPWDTPLPTPTADELERDSAWLAGGVSEYTNPFWRLRNHR